MSTLPSVDDLELVHAIDAEGSIGGAARRLHISQPSASARLASIERRCGTRLFNRDTTGARPTDAGAEMIRQAIHILGHLEGVVSAVRAADRRSSLRIGTFVSFGPSVFPSIEEIIGEPVLPYLSHGPQLVHMVDEGTLDAAVVGVAEQMTLPRTVRVHPIGADDLVIFRQSGTPGAASGRRPLAGRRMIVATYDQHGPEVIDRLRRLGAEAEPAASLPTAIAMARRVGCLAVVPRSALAHVLSDTEVCDALPFRQRIRISLVTPRDADPRLDGCATLLRTALHLRPARS
ncbi:LysR family transcriptional regulator [Yimella sp. cx-573]|nr:LysR family transcriptional regulator [Yimella sp. cx-573]